MFTDAVTYWFRQQMRVLRSLARFSKLFRQVSFNIAMSLKQREILPTSFLARSLLWQNSSNLKTLKRHLFYNRVRYKSEFMYGFCRRSIRSPFWECLSKRVSHFMSNQRGEYLLL